MPGGAAELECDGSRSSRRTSRADREVGRFFTEAGFDVAAITGLRCPTATDIARVGEERLRELVAELDGPEVDAIVQVGTNLSFVAQADRLEQELGKPVVAINAATLWHALREHGIADQVPGAGRCSATTELRLLLGVLVGGRHETGCRAGRPARRPPRPGTAGR